MPEPATRRHPPAPVRARRAPVRSRGGYDAASAPGGDPPAGHGTGHDGAPRQNGLGTAALVVGISAGIFGVAFFPLGLVLGVVGTVWGSRSRKRARRGEATNGGMALTGLVLSIVGVLIAIALAFFVGYIFSQAEDCADPGRTQTEQRHSLEDKLGIEGSRGGAQRIKLEGLRTARHDYDDPTASRSAGASWSYSGSRASL